MAATSISICSNALLKLGSRPIASFSEPGDQARLCANLYPLERDAVLRSHTWNCCVKRVQLPQLADAPTYGFRRAYQMPGDWIRTIRLGDYGDTATEFRQEGRTLLTDGDANLRYVFRNENEGTWDALLVEVVTARMAWALAYPVTKSTSLRDSMREEYEYALRRAKSIDSMEEPTDTVAEGSPLIDVRY